jgi:DNA gyrase subunit A
LQPGEKVVKLLCTPDLENKQIVTTTKNGLIKRTDAMAFAKIRQTGIRAITLNEGDELAFCAISSGNDSIVLATSFGQGIRFKETEVRSMGRQAAGVIGIRLRKGDFVVGMQIVGTDGDLLFATERGYGKRVSINDFRVAHRGGVGVRTIPTTPRNGMVIGLVLVYDTSTVLLIDEAGKIIRLSPTEIRTMGRQAKGVRLIRLEEGQKLAAVVAFDESDGSDNAQGGEASGVESASVSHAAAQNAPAYEDEPEDDEDYEEDEFADDADEGEFADQKESDGELEAMGFDAEDDFEAGSGYQQGIF